VRAEVEVICENRAWSNVNLSIEIYVTDCQFFFLDILKINCKAVAGMRRLLLTCIKILVAFVGIISNLKTVKNCRKNTPQVITDLVYFLTY